MKSFTKRARIAAAVAVVLGAIGVAGAQGYGGYGGMMGGGYGNGAGYGPGMMGGGMMGLAGADRPVDPDWGGGVLSSAQVRAYLAAAPAAARVDAKADTITYSGRDITIDMVAVQPGHDDQTFEVGGLTNPTLVVPAGATVHLNLVNMDWGRNMEHGVIITLAPPPYPYMAMMATGPGLAQVMPLLPWRSAKDLQQAQYASLSATFVAGNAGTYWYVCPTPQHAQKGMYGKLVVL